MADTREKLIDLIIKFCCGLTVADITPPFGYENLADYLIANGVTVLTADEQRNVCTVKEIEEIQGEAYDLALKR